MSEDPILAQCEVLLENGAWTVYLEVWFVDGIERKRIDSYPSEHKARIAARWIAWAARRQISTPTGL
ncbi:MAG: hypothetical protein HRU13_08770 [Phycisphaerales bacterium]|nr:hypothetical protein [Phycisphaerales bacterium]